MIGSRSGPPARGSIDRSVFVVAAVLAVGLAFRLLYVVLQPSYDPSLDRPMLDGRLYLDAARRLLEGGVIDTGAFYLAPGYPTFVAGLFALVGRSVVALYVAQHVAVVIAAGLLAIVSGRAGGGRAAIATSVLVLGYGPLQFYASRPLSEPLSIVLLAAALALSDSNRVRRSAAGGAILGLASLVRPNLLPLAALWPLPWIRRAPRSAIAMWLAAAIVIVPVTLRNYRESGHVVPISSNAGITLYHGNGPGARGVYTAPEGFSGAIADQRASATAIASRAEARALDPVEADRWWGRQAIATRLDRPAETVVLLAERIALTTSSREISVGYAPAIDANPMRFAAPLPFGILLGLAVAGVVGRGFRATGGWRVWSTVATCAAVPVVFYVSSRYRLPLSAVLCVPAGVGAAWLLDADHSARRRAGVGALTVAVVALSFAPVGSGTVDVTRASALANRGSLWNERGQPERAIIDLREAIAIDPASVVAWHNLGVVERSRGALADAELAFRQAIAIDDGHAESAGNLASMLVRSGRAEEGIDVLRRALTVRPEHRVCRQNLVVALVTVGRVDEAALEIERAETFGIELPAELVHGVERAVEAGKAKED